MLASMFGIVSWYRSRKWVMKEERTLTGRRSLYSHGEGWGDSCDITNMLLE